MTRILLADVARAAGVSVATVSRALSGRGDLHEATRDRVRAAAASLGYAPGGRGASRPDARHIDLVLHGFDGRWARRAAAAVRAAAAARGLDLVLTQERDNDGDEWTGRVCDRGSRGVLLGVVRPTTAQRAVLRTAGIPLVLLEPRSDDPVDVPTVRATDGPGAAGVADHLVARGAERFAVAVSTPAYRFGRERVRGYTDRLHELRPDVTVVRTATGSDGNAARTALRTLLAEAAGTRLGVFAYTDELAVEVYRVAAELSRRIPDDVLVCGFDDVPGSSFMIPPLTTVHQPIRRMAERALDLLLHPRAEPEHVDLPTRLVVRGST